MNTIRIKIDKDEILYFDGKTWISNGCWLVKVKPAAFTRVTVNKKDIDGLIQAGVKLSRRMGELDTGKDAYHPDFDKFIEENTKDDETPLTCTEWGRRHNDTWDVRYLVDGTKERVYFQERFQPLLGLGTLTWNGKMAIVRDDEGEVIACVMPVKTN